MHNPIQQYTDDIEAALVNRARPLSRFCVTGSNGQGKAKEGLAEVINVHNKVFYTSQGTCTVVWLARLRLLCSVASLCNQSVSAI